MSDRRHETSEPEEVDPTGVRDLLSSLGDPGPMPPALVSRIQCSLDEAARERSATPPTPAAAPHPAAPALSTPTDLDAARSRRRARWVFPVAAAAAVLLVGGAFGIAALRNPTSPESSTSVALSETTSEGTAPSAPGADSGKPLADHAATPFILTISKTAYTEEAFSDQARDLADQPPEPVSPNAPEAPTLGPLATARGAQDCLRSLGSDATAVRVDVGTFDGAPGMLVLGREPDGARSAWAVSQGCQPIYPEPARW